MPPHRPRRALYTHPPGALDQPDRFALEPDCATRLCSLAPNSKRWVFIADAVLQRTCDPPWRPPNLHRTARLTHADRIEQRSVPDVNVFEGNGSTAAISVTGKIARPTFEVIVGRSVPEDRDARYVGLLHGYDPKPKRRLFATLKSQGLQANQDVTFLTDAGEEIRALTELVTPASEHVLDWFQITMRLTVLEQYARGVAHHDEDGGGKPADRPGTTQMAAGTATSTGRGKRSASSWTT